MTLNLPASEKHSLRRLAERKGVSQSEILRRSIVLYRMIEKWRQKGARLYVHDKDGSTTELVIF